MFLVPADGGHAAAVPARLRRAGRVPEQHRARSGLPTVATSSSAARSRAPGHCGLVGRARGRRSRGRDRRVLERCPGRRHAGPLRLVRPARPDGRGIDQSEGVNLYRVRIAPGDFRVTGPPEPLTSGTGMSYLAVGRQDGQIVLSALHRRPQLWAIDPGAARLPEAAAADPRRRPEVRPSPSPGPAPGSVYSACGGTAGAAADRDPRAGPRERRRRRSAVQASGRRSHVPARERGRRAPGWQDLVDGKRVASSAGPASSAGRRSAGTAACTASSPTGASS